jgi:DNA modification methylase
MSVDIVIGDCREILPTLEAESVHCVVTSPPYYGLRDYGVDGQMGLEQSPDEYIAGMVAVFREVRRVLRKDGTCWVNMGDSYAGDTKGSGGPTAKQKTNSGSFYAPRKFSHGAKPKDLLMMPARLALALQADGWWLRSDIIWAKPNPMPESVTDRSTSAHEHVFLLSKAAKYFYDAEAVREEPQSGPSDLRNMAEQKPRIGGKHKTLNDSKSKASAATNIGQKRSVGDPSGRNLRNVWTIATEPFRQAHFATFPTKLVEPCIKAGTSEKGCCAACGSPWVRETLVSYTEAGQGNNNMKRKGSERDAMASAPYDVRKLKNVETLGWSPSCRCNAEVVPTTILDPFSGAGTTGLVADRLGRNAIMIELNPAYADMALDRLQGDAPLLSEVRSRKSEVRGGESVSDFRLPSSDF